MKTFTIMYLPHGKEAKEWIDVETNSKKKLWVILKEEWLSNKMIIAYKLLELWKMGQYLLYLLTKKKISIKCLDFQDVPTKGF
jgi:hypothetical protein